MACFDPAERIFQSGLKVNGWKLPELDHSIEINAPKDRIWEIISDLEHKCDYWYGTKDVRIISKNGNEINREITQNFRNHKILQRAVLHPMDYVEIEYLKGLTEGKKTIYLLTKNENQSVRVLWG